MEIVHVPREPRGYPVVVDESDAQLLSDLLSVPVWLIPGPRREPYYPGLEIMKYISENFAVVGEFRDFEIRRRNGR